MAGKSQIMQNERANVAERLLKLIYYRDVNNLQKKLCGGCIRSQNELHYEKVLLLANRTPRRRTLTRKCMRVGCTNILRDTIISGTKKRELIRLFSELRKDGNADKIYIAIKKFKSIKPKTGDKKPLSDSDSSDESSTETSSETESSSSTSSEEIEQNLERGNSEYDLRNIETPPPIFESAFSEGSILDLLNEASMGDPDRIPFADLQQPGPSTLSAVYEPELNNDALLEIYELLGAEGWANTNENVGHTLLPAIRETPSTPTTINPNTSMESTNDPGIDECGMYRMPELSWVCCVCRKDEIDTVLMPCGHKPVCNLCAQIIKFCPTCDKQIKNLVQ